MSTDLLVIVDDNTDAFRYSSTGASTPWILSTLNPFYKSTSWYPESTPTSIGGFTFTFNGTSVAFIGNTPPPDSPQTATVQIDNGTSFSSTTKTPIHNLTSNAIDYVVVTVGNQTPLAGQTVIVDNDSSLIQYSGRWSRSTDKFVPGFLPTGSPYGNSTHRSSNPGDTFTFRFSGTSIAVYGVFSWYNLGSLTVTYSIDGSPSPISVTTSTISVTPTSPNYLRNDGDFSNYLYFGLDSLPSGSHTLLVNITEAKNQTFMLDYITYKPSFSTLSSMPSLSNISSGTTRPGASTTSSSSKPQRSVSTGAIVGGVIGGLAFVFLVLMLFLFFRRRARKRDYAYHEATPSASINYPSYSYPPPNSFEMQESLSFRPQPADRAISPFTLPVSQRTDAKHHVQLTCATDPLRNTTPVPSSITDNAIGVEDPIHDPPAYDALSNRFSRQH